MMMVVILTVIMETGSCGFCDGMSGKFHAGP